MPSSIPDQPEELNAAFVNELVGEMHPGVQVEECEILGISRCGEPNVSTSARASLKLNYSGQQGKNLPSKIIAKMSMTADLPDDVWTSRLYPYYENEVSFYRRIRPELNIETPAVVGARYDPQIRRYVLLLEDMTENSVHFSSMMDDTGVEEVQNILDVLAQIHARFWDSPRLKSDFAWVSTHVSGDVEAFRRKYVYEGARHEVARYKIKREILAALGMNVDEILACVHAVKKHQNANLPQMLLHGDTHQGNTYQTTDRKGGVYDWQNFCRGFGIFDVVYYMNTALSVDLRRKHERDLLAYYRDRLGAYGVADLPSLDALWLEHRRQALVSFFPGWFCTPVINYGWDVLMVGLYRLSTAIQDLESRKAIASLM